jgi:hypothetical protein
MPKEVLDSTFPHATELFPKGPFLPREWDNYKDVLISFGYSPNNFFELAFAQLAKEQKKYGSNATHIALDLLRNISRSQPTLTKLLKEHEVVPAEKYLTGPMAFQSYPQH